MAGNVLLFLVCVAYLWWVIYRLTSTRKKTQELMASSENKEPEDWTDDERRVRLRHLESMKAHLTFTQYDILKAKYTGTTSLYEQFGVDFGTQMDMAGAQAKATQIAQKEATKTIVKSAVVGGVVAGPAGAVVGAVVGKNKVDATKETK